MTLIYLSSDWVSQKLDIAANLQRIIREVFLEKQMLFLLILTCSLDYKHHWLKISSTHDIWSSIASPNNIRSYVNIKWNMKGPFIPAFKIFQKTCSTLLEIRQDKLSIQTIKR